MAGAASRKCIAARRERFRVEGTLRLTEGVVEAILVKAPIHSNKGARFASKAITCG